MPLLTSIALIVAVISFAVALYNYYSALADVMSRLPVQYQDHLRVGSVLGNYIWEPSFPKAARRKYLVSLVSGCIAILAVAVILWMQERSPIPSILATIIGLYGAALAAIRWHKYRNRF
jgi:hypothetical protein